MPGPLRDPSPHAREAVQRLADAHRRAPARDDGAAAVDDGPPGESAEPALTPPDAPDRPDTRPSVPSSAPDDRADGP